MPTPPKSAAETRRIMKRLGTQHPNADTELHFTNAYELLVATILSAQCTDERVNQVTPALFARYPTPRALARATTDELEPQIQSTGFFRAKSRSLVGMATESSKRTAARSHGRWRSSSRCRASAERRRTSCSATRWACPALPVDRHVLRVANRIGIAKSDDPEIVEQQLCAAMPPPSGRAPPTR